MFVKTYYLAFPLMGYCSVLLYKYWAKYEWVRNNINYLLAVYKFNADNPQLYSVLFSKIILIDVRLLQQLSLPSFHYKILVSKFNIPLAQYEYVYITQNDKMQFISIYPSTHH